MPAAFAVRVAVTALVACRTVADSAATPPAKPPARVIEGVAFPADASLMFLTPEQSLWPVAFKRALPDERRAFVAALSAHLSDSRPSSGNR